MRADGAISGTSIYGTGLTATTISATTYQNLPSFNYVRITGTTQFSAGTNNYLNFSGVNITITSGSNNTLIFSAGTGSGGVTADTFTTGFTYSNNTFTIARNQGQSSLTATINTVTGFTVNGNLSVTGGTFVGVSPSSGVKIWGYSTTSSTIGVRGDGTTGGVYGNTSTAGGYGVRGDAASSIGVYGISLGDTGTNIGVKGYTDISSAGNPTNIGGYFTAANGGTNYSLQLSDGTESVGRYLKCITSDGKANWATIPSSSFTGGTVSGPTTFTSGLTSSTISATTITGTTIYGDGSNLTGVATFQQVLRITSLGI